MPVASNLVALFAGASVVTAQNGAESVMFSKIFEGNGVAKGIQIKSVEGRGPSLPLTDVSIAIASNGRALEDANVVYRLPEYGAESRFQTFISTTITLCTEDAVEQDVSGFLCGDKPIILPSQSPILSFNGNDMLVLRRKIRGVDTVVDYFGNDSGKNFEICGRRNANIESILTRKSSVKEGQYEQLSAETPCEWEYESLALPFQAKPFSTDVVFKWPVSSSGIYLGDSDGNDVTELFLSAPGVEKIRIKDLEKGKSYSPTSTGFASRDASQAVVCIKQESYILNQESLCEYFWDAGLGATDPETGGPIPFSITVSGAYAGNLPRFIERNLFVFPNYLTPRECAVTTENPIDSVFKNYVESYSCFDGCETAAKQWGQAAECADRTRYYRYNANGEEEYVPEGYDTQTCRVKLLGGDGSSCSVDAQCSGGRPGAYCSSFFSECRSTTYQIKVRSTNVDNMVIPAGETRTVNFLIDSVYGDVSQEGNIYFVTTAAADLRYEVTGAPSLDVVGIVNTVTGSTSCESAEVEQGATSYYLLTGGVVLQSDDRFDGLWNYSVTNEGTEDVTILAAFKDFETIDD